MQANFKLFAAIALCCAAARADTLAVFNFDSDTPGTSTTFTDTDNGISATFSSSADPGGFVVYPSIFETLTGNVLGDPGPAGANGIPLDIDFSQNLSAITLDFATADFSAASPLTITAYENTNLVGSNTSVGEFLSGFTFPEGEIAFDGATFNNVVISSSSPDLAVDNIEVATAAASPEPGTLTMIASGLLLAAIGTLRSRARG
jgi:hypothetical protein